MRQKSKSETRRSHKRTRCLWHGTTGCPIIGPHSFGCCIKLPLESRINSKIKQLATSLETIANGTERQSEPLSEPEPCQTAAEFVLTPNRNSGRWMVSFDLGSHHYEYASNFYASDSPDPLIKHLRQQTNGELKVIVNL